jgi:hypothetical protein
MKASSGLAIATIVAFTPFTKSLAVAFDDIVEFSDRDKFIVSSMAPEQ